MTGNGDKETMLVPARVAEGLVFDSICASYENTCGLDAFGTAYCFKREETCGV